MLQTLAKTRLPMGLVDSLGGRGIHQPSMQCGRPDAPSTTLSRFTAPPPKEPTNPSLVSFPPSILLDCKVTVKHLPRRLWIAVSEYLMDPLTGYSEHFSNLPVCIALFNLPTYIIVSLLADFLIWFTHNPQPILLSNNLQGATVNSNESN